MNLLQAPGRLGDPNMHLATDPRTHPKLLERLRADGIAGTPTFVASLLPDAPLDQVASFTRQVEEYLEEYYNNTNLDLVPGEGGYPITRREERVPCGGDDDRSIRLIIHRPVMQAQPQHTQPGSGLPSLPSPLPNALPAVIYLHGGAMVMLSTTNPLHTSWAEALASTGLVVISPDFRNALPGINTDASQLQLHPFPAGLDDCVVAVRWVAGHREVLGISKIVLQGESGGGNLALATALRAQREGWLQPETISGVCASVPYISGPDAYGAPRGWKLRELPSLVECDGYIMSCANSSLNARLYDPEGTHARDPLAWPYWADEERDLRGLPPHLIITSELDMLRDEGNAYYRKLVAAGVRAVGRVNLGITHMGELSYRHALPDVYLDNLWAIKSFIDWL